MKHKIFFLMTAGIIIILAVVLSGPLAIFIAKRQLKNIFKESAVTIKQCSINPLNSVIFSGVEINKPSSYDIKCKQISIRYGIKIYLDDCSVSARLADKEINFNLAASCVIDLRKRLLDGEFSVRDFFNGSAGGNMKLTLGKLPAYAINLRTSDIDLEVLIKDFKLQDKMQATGKLYGNIFIKGIGLQLEEVSGNLEAAPPGGELTITDTDYLKNLPVKSGVSWQALVASLKNYRYNIGTLKSSLEENNLIFTINLSGETGKRDFTIALHDFKI